ncbi:C40 family peptidase [Burkholderia dolosa]|uniref:C40 family peptidase n=2 Tax=Burkholderia dolosa TaxID=152500 RepID=A0A892I926_9BURK|nr:MULTISPECIES: C40 family peptidase [Burkholderia]AKE03512.1 hydrolase Nlp/P60 [Burkholderia cepacia]AJY12769.1 nlpC/P60 family protein [Burkholderia dolosa AU0158]AYZ98274.1 peptidoglycan endopeptidase [Burkholderia dolosa]ETP65339.1 hydrolase Nlp/P60 [Burkholderia dolosa PC543]MBR8417362.1 C40 family peptidase [Burkholderia dolosa]
MLRIWVPVAVVSLLAACSSVPPQSASRPSGMKITTPRAFPPPANFPKFVDHSVGQEEISIQAMSLVGVPYRWGGNTPTSGFDCSGLVRYVIGRAADVELPRTTADMSSRGVPIEPDQIAPGDLIFFNTTGRPHSHVGIYVGKLRFVNAPSTGGTVRLDYLTNPYWAKRFDGIRRVAPSRATPTPFDAPTYEARRDESVAPAAAVAAAPVPAPRVSGARPAPAPVAATASTAAPRAAATDPFEPPPARIAAARQQAESAGAISPPVATAATAATGADTSIDTASQARDVPATPAPAGVTIPTIAIQPSDALAAAGDKFEPPPAARAAAQQAWSREPAAAPVQIMRASTQSAPVNAAADDPIARFANGSY